MIIEVRRFQAPCPICYGAYSVAATQNYRTAPLSPLKNSNHQICFPSSAPKATRHNPLIFLYKLQFPPHETMLFPFHEEQHNLHKPKHTTGIYLPVLLQFINIAEKPLYRTTPTLKGGSYPAYIQNLSLSKTKSIYLNTPCTNALTHSKPNSLIAKPNIKICPKNKQESSPQNSPLPPSKQPTSSLKTAHFLPKQSLFLPKKQTISLPQTPTSYLKANNLLPKTAHFSPHKTDNAPLPNSPISPHKTAHSLPLSKQLPSPNFRFLLQTARFLLTKQPDFPPSKQTTFSLKTARFSTPKQTTPLSQTARFLPLSKPLLLQTARFLPQNSPSFSPKNKPLPPQTSAFSSKQPDFSSQNSPIFHPFYSNFPKPSSSFSIRQLSRYGVLNQRQTV